VPSGRTGYPLGQPRTADPIRRELLTDVASPRRGDRRQTIRFNVQDYAAKYVGYPVDTADLVQREGLWWLHVVVSVPAPEVEQTDAVVGVDLGLNRPAVTSNNQFLGQRRWKAVEGRYFRLSRALQKNGTKSAKRHLRKAKRRRSRFRKDADHVLSKQIVAAAEPGATIVLENLKDIRKRTRQGKRTTNSARPSAACIRGRLQASKRRSSTRPRNGVVRWLRSIRDIPRSAVAAVGIPPAPTAGVRASSSVGNVDCI
jgi:probable transposase